MARSWPRRPSELAPFPHPPALLPVPHSPTHSSSIAPTFVGQGPLVRWLGHGLRLVVASMLALGSTSCLYGRIMYFGAPTLSAPTYFENRPVAATSPKPLDRRHEVHVDVTEAARTTYASFDDLLKQNRTRSFLWIRDDAVVYERYFDGVTAATQLPSFSMSKTFASVLVGCALSDGLIRSIDDKLVTYVPDLAGKTGYGEVTLEQLLRMTSGIDFVEDSYAGAALYYSTDLRARMYSYPVTRTPGSHYLYGSIGMALMWDVLDRRLDHKTVSRYFEERLWNALGAEYPAAWSLDSPSSGVEKLFGGFSATTRDHARLGLLFLHGGTMNGRTVVSPEWIRESLAPDPVADVVHTTDGSVRRGKYQWFLTLDGKAYFAKGYHGQYVFVIPKERTVFVRFGDDYGAIDWPGLFVRLAESLSSQRHPH
jgi:CubicO group peptidase (beta-lactamase class C family)